MRHAIRSMPGVRLPIVVVALLSGAAVAVACSSDEESAVPDVDAGTGTGGSSQTGGTSGSGSGAATSGGASGTPGGRGCDNPDPAWLLCEDFEGMEQGFDAWLSGSAWTENIGGDDPGRMTSSSEAHGGKWALFYPAAASSGYQGADLVYRSCAGTNQPGCQLTGYPELYFRAYFRLAGDHQKVHHFLAIGGGQLDDYWGPYGNAGCRPNGQNAMGTTVDFSDGDHATFFYTYYPEMSCDPGSVCDNYADPQQICDGCAQKGMPCSSGLECCWGNHFKPDPPVTLPLDQWVCFEMMMRANDVGQANGSMAYWINGVLAHEVSGMHFRDVEQLQLNKASLQHYLTSDDAGGHSNRIWFDDVVISTSRIGCL